MDNRITIILELLSAGVIASLVAGIFSLVIAFKNNKRLVELEKSKQKFTVNQERYKGLREAYAELLNVLPEEKLLGHIIINLPSQKNFQENGLSEAYEAAEAIDELETATPIPVPIVPFIPIPTSDNIITLFFLKQV